MQIFEEYSTGAKDKNDIPTGKRILTKDNAMTAAKEIINEWTKVSPGALNKFISDNFDQVWQIYDQNK